MTVLAVDGMTTGIAPSGCSETVADPATLTLQLTGADLEAVLMRMALRGGDPVAGVQYKLEAQQALNIRVGGQPLDPARTYRVCTNDYILDGGGNVIVADLPIPSWLARQSPLNASYNAQKAEWLKQMAGRKRLTFVEMQSAFADDEFVDEVHPKPRITKEWSRLLAAAVSQETAKAGTAP